LSLGKDIGAHQHPQFGSVADTLASDVKIALRLCKMQGDVRMRSTSRGIGIAALVLLMLSTFGVKADLFQYDYEGNPFNIFIDVYGNGGGGPSPFEGKHVTASVIVDVGTPPIPIAVEDLFSVRYITIRDGITSYSGPEVAERAFGWVRLNPTYNITAWSVAAGNRDGSFGAFPFPSTNVGTSYSADSAVVYAISPSNDPIILAANAVPAGTWSEPTTLLLPSSPPATAFSPTTKNAAAQLATASGVAANATAFLSFLGAVAEGSEFAEVFSLLVGSMAGEGVFGITIESALDTRGFFEACTSIIIAGKRIGPYLCSAAAIVIALKLVKEFARAVAIDPPDPNYQQVYAPVITAPPTGLTGICSDLNDTAQATFYSLDAASDWLNALYVTNNRYQTALGNNDISSATLQYAVFQSYLGSYNTAGRLASTDLRCYSDLLAAAGLGNQLATLDDVAAGLKLFPSLTSDDILLLDDIFSTLGLSPTDVSELIAMTELNPPSLPSVTTIDALNNVANSFEPASVPEPSSLHVLAAAIIALMAIKLFYPPSIKTKTQRTAPTTFIITNVQNEAGCVFLYRNRFKVRLRA
jgi:hypothetical protein